MRQIFRSGRNVIAGTYVTEGRIIRGGARVYRGGALIATDRIESLRRFRDDVREVVAGYECGIGLDDFNEVEEGDIIECFSKQMVSRIASMAQADRSRLRTRRARTCERQQWKRSGTDGARSTS